MQLLDHVLKSKWSPTPLLPFSSEGREDDGATGEGSWSRTMSEAESSASVDFDMSGNSTFYLIYAIAIWSLEEEPRDPLVTWMLGDCPAGVRVMYGHSATYPCPFFFLNSFVGISLTY